MPNCKVKGCGTGGGNSKEKIHMFGFPKDESTKKKWKEILGMPDSEEVTGKGRFRGVCAKHFEDDAFIPDHLNVDSRGRPRMMRRLRPLALPTLCLTRISNKNKQPRNEEFLEKKFDETKGAFVHIWKNTSCCVVTCPSPDEVEYFCVVRPHKEQTRAWLLTVNQINGTSWIASECLNKRICGTHFLSGKPNPNRSDPDWCPSIFKVLLREAKTNRDQILMNVNVKCEPDPDPLFDDNINNDDEEGFEPESKDDLSVHVKQEKPSSEDESETVNLLQCNESISDSNNQVNSNTTLVYPSPSVKLESDITISDPLSEDSIQTYMSQKDTWTQRAYGQTMEIPPNPIPAKKVYNILRKKPKPIQPKPLSEETIQTNMSQKDTLTPSEYGQHWLSALNSIPTKKVCNKSEESRSKPKPPKRQRYQKVFVDAKCQTDLDLVGKPSFNFCSGFIENRNSVLAFRDNFTVFEAWTQIDTKFKDKTEDKATETFHEKTASKHTLTEFEKEGCAITRQALKDDKKCRAMCGISLDLLNQTRSILKDKFLKCPALTPDDQLVLYLAKENCNLSEQNIATMFEVYFTTVRKVYDHMVKIHRENIDQLEYLPLPIHEDLESL